MEVRSFEQIYQGRDAVDLCFACAGIWFQHQVSARLAPGAVIELFKEIHAHLDGARRPLAEALRCPDCGDALALCHDLCRSGRFTYFRCPNGDGRYTPFFQFLREKQFVRSLTPVEMQKLRAEVRQIRCSGCGAPIDLEHSDSCSFCHAPVAFLDQDAVQKALQMWSAADERRRAAPSAAAVAEALLTRFPEPSPVRPAGGLAMADVGEGAELGVDLIVLGVRALGALLQ